MITFKQQFDKLTEAYIRNEVNPYSSCGCFIGNLFNKTRDWIEGRAGFMPAPGVYEFTNKTKLIREIKKHAFGFYDPEEILELETRFCKTYQLIDPDGNGEDEDALFIAFEEALDLLKMIHESKGEIVDDFQFVKRKCQVQQYIF